jgi:hypothetical protein
MRGLCVALLALLVLGPTAEAASKSSQSDGGKKKTYTWVDDRGVRHYGDSVPAQYSQREQRVLNRQGVEVARTDAQKSHEELAREAELNRAAARKKQHDMFLLSTYSSVKDLETVRDARLDQLEDQVTAAQAYISTLDERMLGLRERVMIYRPYNDSRNARRMPDDLAEQIVRTMNEIRTQNRTLDAKRQEQTAMREQFELDIKRYRELKSAMVPSAVAQR